MKNLAVPLTDDSFAKFAEIQRKRKFANQSDTLTHVIDVAYKEETKQ